MALKYVDPSTGNLIEIKIKAAESLPLGTILEYTGTTAPNGYMLCDGNAISRTTYSALFNLIGTAYGAGDGSTTFNLPDKRGKVGVGYDSTNTNFNILGKTGGEETHVLTEDEMPSHVHKANFSLGGAGNAEGRLVLGNNTQNGTTSGNYGSPIASAGGGQAHNNIQPYITLNYIIKVEEIIPVAGKVINQKDSTNETSTYSCKYIDENVGGGDTLPIGAIVPFGGTTIPNGYLECNGEVYSIDDYPDLYAAIGLTWVNSSVHGASTGYFCVPDLGGRVPVGQTDELSALNYDGTYVMGGYGGNEKHTHTIKIGHATWYGVPMSESNLGLYIMDESGNRSSTSSASGRLPTTNRSRNAALTTSMTTLSHDGFATETQGTSYSQYTMQPYLVTKYIIKAFNVKAISNRAEVINNLSSSSITDALSAAMGAQLYGETLFTGDTTSSSISINKSISLFHRIKIYGYVVHNSEPNNKSLNFGQEFLVSGNNDRYCISGLSYAGSTYMYMFGCVLTISGTSVTRGTNVKIYSTQPDTDDNIVLHITEIRGFYS